MSSAPEIRRTGLGFDWEEVKGAAVTAAMGRVELELGGLTAVALVLEGQAVIVAVDEDTDQVSVALQPFRPPAGEIWGPHQALGDLVGQPLGWCWETRNHQGYLDGFMLAAGRDIDAGALTPRWLFMAEGAVLTLHRLAEG